MRLELFYIKIVKDAAKKAARAAYGAKDAASEALAVSVSACWDAKDVRNEQKQKEGVS